MLMNFKPYCIQTRECYSWTSNPEKSLTASHGVSASDLAQDIHAGMPCRRHPQSPWRCGPCLAQLLCLQQLGCAASEGCPVQPQCPGHSASISAPCTMSQHCEMSGGCVSSYLQFNLIASFHQTVWQSLCQRQGSCW